MNVRRRATFCALHFVLRQFFVSRFALHFVLRPLCVSPFAIQAEKGCGQVNIGHAA